MWPPPVMTSTSRARSCTTSSPSRKPIRLTHSEFHARDGKYVQFPCMSEVMSFSPCSTVRPCVLGCVNALTESDRPRTGAPFSSITLTPTSITAASGTAANPSATTWR